MHLNQTSPILLPAAEPLSWWCEEINRSVLSGERKLAFRLKDSFRYQLHLFSVHDPNYTNVFFRISVKLKALLVRFQLSSSSSSSVCVCVCVCVFVCLFVYVCVCV